MQFFNERQTSTLELLDHTLNQPVIDVEQAKKYILEYHEGKKEPKDKGEQIFETIENILCKVALNLPAQFNYIDALKAREKPNTTLTKISDLIWYYINLTKGCDSAIDLLHQAKRLLNQVKTLIEVNIKIVACTDVRKAFFDDLSKSRNLYVDTDALKDIYLSMNKTNDEAIQEAMKLHP